MKHSRPADIERTSMAIIAEELRQRGIQVPPDQEAVVKRVIHTTADFEYAENLVFTKNAVSLGVAALRKGTPIVTDTNMAKAGISRPGLEKLGSHVMCFMADPAVAQRAEARGTTRAAAAMEQAAQVCPGAVLAIGNAPTALFAIARQMERGQFPAMLIGVPVGFVNVEEAKEQVLALCRRFEVPAILAMGRKGGSGYLQCLALSGRGYAGSCRTRLAVKRKKQKKKALRVSLVQGILGAFWDDFGTFYTVKREEKSKIYLAF